METPHPNPIADYRAQNSLTQEEFGALVGVQKPAVSKWEDGIGPSPQKALEIERATGIKREVLRPDIYPPEAA